MSWFPQECYLCKWIETVTSGNQNQVTSSVLLKTICVSPTKENLLPWHKSTSFLKEENGIMWQNSVYEIGNWNQFSNSDHWEFASWKNVLTIKIKINVKNKKALWYDSLIKKLYINYYFLYKRICKIFLWFQSKILIVTMSLYNQYTQTTILSCIFKIILIEIQKQNSTLYKCKCD